MMLDVGWQCRVWGDAAAGRECRGDDVGSRCTEPNFKRKFKLDYRKEISEMAQLNNLVGEKPRHMEDGWLV